MQFILIERERDMFKKRERKLERVRKTEVEWEWKRKREMLNTFQIQNKYLYNLSLVMYIYTVKAWNLFIIIINPIYLRLVGFKKIIKIKFAIGRGKTGHVYRYVG